MNYSEDNFWIFLFASHKIYVVTPNRLGLQCLFFMRNTSKQKLLTNNQLNITSSGAP